MPAKRRGKSRSKKNFVAIPINGEVALGTLADNTVIDAAIVTLGEDFYAISADLYLSKVNHTPGEGPLLVGLNHGDLSVTEIKEKLVANVQDPDDIIANEQSRRPVRAAGQFPGIAADEVLRNGEPVRTRLKFSIGDAHTLNIFAFNRSAGPLTTGTIIKVTGTLFGRWQR